MNAVDRSLFFIAEAGVNHNGSLDRALALVDAAADMGADAVKFQTFRADQVVQATATTAAYQKTETGQDYQLAMLRPLELDWDAHRRIADRCLERDIEFMSTPFDLASAEFLVSLGMKHMKIPSGELTNLPFLKALAGFDRPMILSTGMGDLEEVGVALDVLEAGRRAAGLEGGLAGRISILHCTSNYPAAPEDANLRAIGTMAEAFGHPTGYSDHTTGMEIPIAAVALGARVIEKHMTLDKNLPGPDHKASMEPAEMKALIAKLRVVARALGDGVKRPVAAEIPMRAVARRSLFLTRAVPKGGVLSAEDLAAMRPGDGVSPALTDEVIGRTARRDLEQGEKLSLGDLA